jgi:hypothetical protein
MPATRPYPEPARSSPYPHIPLPEDLSEYYPPIYTLPQARYPWVISPAAQSKRFLFNTIRPTRPTLEPIKPPIQCITEAPYSKVKRSEREVAHSPPCTVDVKNDWSYNSTALHAFKAWTIGN